MKTQCLHHDEESILEQFILWWWSFSNLGMEQVRVGKGNYPLLLVKQAFFFLYYKLCFWGCKKKKLSIEKNYILDLAKLLWPQDVRSRTSLRWRIQRSTCGIEQKSTFWQFFSMPPYRKIYMTLYNVLCLDNQLSIFKYEC